MAGLFRANLRLAFYGNCASSATYARIVQAQDDGLAGYLLAVNFLARRFDNAKNPTLGREVCRPARLQFPRGVIHKSSARISDFVSISNFVFFCFS
jgi:hypothetical protein